MPTTTSSMMPAGPTLGIVGGGCVDEGVTEGVSTEVDVVEIVDDGAVTVLIVAKTMDVEFADDDALEDVLIVTVMVTMVSTVVVVVTVCVPEGVEAPAVCVTVALVTEVTGSTGAAAGVPVAAAGAARLLVVAYCERACDAEVTAAPVKMLTGAQLAGTVTSGLTLPVAEQAPMNVASAFTS